MTRALIYRRVSTEEQATKWSLASQTRTLREFCERSGWTVAEEFADDGISGATVQDRPGMLALLDALREGRGDVVVVSELTRLSRGRGADWDLILDAVAGAGARIVTPTQSLDPADPGDEFLTALFAALSRRERRTIVARSRRGTRERVLSGRWPNRSPPYGYRVDPEGRLTVVAEEAAVVRRAFASALEGRGFRTIAGDLKDEGVPTARGGAWFATTIKRMLSNPAYLGTVTWREKDGRVTRCENAHEPIIDAATFQSAAQFLEIRSRQGLPRSRPDSCYFLVGLLKCPCGGRMHGGTVSVKASGKKYRYYVCNMAGRPSADRWCAKYRADVIEPLVLEDIVRVLGTDSVMEEARRRIVEQRMRGGSSEIKRRAEIQAAIADSERRVSLMYEDRLAGHVAASQFAAFNAKELEDQQRLRDDLRRVEDALLALGGGLDVTQVFAQLGDLAKALEALTPAERRQLVGQVVSAVRVAEYDRYHLDDAQVNVEYRTPFVASADASPIAPESPDAPSLARGA